MIMDSKTCTTSVQERETEEDDISFDMEGNQNTSEKEEGELSSDDDYQMKLSELQTYVPLLQQIIQRLEESNDKTREAQLQKMKSLHGILSNTKKKLKFDALKRCEDVLKNLMQKVEKSVTLSKDPGKTKRKYRWDSITPRRANDSPVSDSSRSSEPSSTFFSGSVNASNSAKMKNASSQNSLERSLSSHSLSRCSDGSELHNKFDDASDRNKPHLSTNKSNFVERTFDHDAVVSSTTQSVDGENSTSKCFTEVLQTLAITNPPAQAHEEIKSKVSSSTSQRNLVTSTSPISKEKQNEKNEVIPNGLEQSRERLKKLLNQISSSPANQSSSEMNAKSIEDDKSPVIESPHQKEGAWDGFSVGSDSCDSELFTRRDGHILERGRGSAPSVSHSLHEDRKDESPVCNVKNSEKPPPLSKSDLPLKSPSLKSPSLSSPPFNKVFSPDHGDESDKSDCGSGAKSIRAKLEQEIHKMHRVGVSTGGALRGLAHKDNKIDISPKSLKSVDRIVSEENEQSKEKAGKADDRPLDRRRLPSIDKSPVKNVIPDPSLVVRKKSPVKLAKPANVTPVEPKKERKSLSQLSHEELQRIVTENLHDLPSPPPIPREILENKMSPNGHIQGTNWQPINPPQKEPIPLTPASPDEQFHSPSYVPQDPFFMPQNSYGATNQGIVHDHRAAMQGHHMGQSVPHQNFDGIAQSSQPVQPTQHFEQRPGVVYLKDVDLRPFQQVEEARYMQLGMTHGRESQQTVVHNAVDSGRPPWPVDHRGRTPGIVPHNTMSQRSIEDHRSRTPGIEVAQNVMSPRSIEDHGGRTPGIEVAHNAISQRSIEDRRCRTPGIEVPHNALTQRCKTPGIDVPHRVDDPRMVGTNNFSDDSRPKPIEDRPPGERRRGLLPTPPKHTYQSPQVNRMHSQEMAQRYDQRMKMTENRGLMSPEQQQTWEWNHGQNITHETYKSGPVQGSDRYQQQMYRREARGQAPESPSPVGHNQMYQWGANDNRATQQGMHGNYMSGYKVHPSRSDMGHSKGNTRQSKVDPRFHKSEATLHSPEIPSLADVRPFGASGVKSDTVRVFSPRQQQPSVSGVARQPCVSERDPRRRSIEETDNFRRGNKEEEEKKNRTSDSWRSRYGQTRSDQSRRKPDRGKRDTDIKRSSDELMKEKAEKERISPLDALYGTTVPKTGKGYGFQNFRIPKIKREPLTPRPPTPPRPGLRKEKFDDAGICEMRREREGTVYTKQEIKEEVQKEESKPKEQEIQPKDITLEFIESLIHKSLESGEGKKIFENARFLETLSEKLKAKSFKKIRRILESDSDSDDEGDKSKTKKEDEGQKEEKIESPKSKVTVVVLTDDSDDEPLSVKVESKNKEKADETDEDPEKPKGSSVCANETEKPVESAGEAETKSQIVNKEGVSDGKPARKPAAKRRNSLELLQQDIRDMFIREGVVTATGYRMCRLLKEVQGGASLDDLTKHEAKRMEAETEENLDTKNDKNLGSGKSNKKSPSSAKPNKKTGKGYIAEDESEEETASLSSVRRRSKRSRIDDSPDSDSSTCTTRSTRSTRLKSSAIQPPEITKDNIKRKRVPRIVLEKTDISKFRIPKTPTESSDESIDELLDEIASDNYVLDKRKPKKSCSKDNSKKGVAKKRTKKVSDSEVEDGLRAGVEKDDDGSFLFMRRRNKDKKYKPVLDHKINDVINKLHKGKVLTISLIEVFPPPVRSRLRRSEEKFDEKQTVGIILDSGNESNDSALLINRLNEKDTAPEDDNKSDCLLPEVPETSDISYRAPEDKIIERKEEEDCRKNSPIKINLIKKKTTQKKKKRTRWQYGIIKKKSASHKLKVNLDAENNKELLETDNADGLSNQEEQYEEKRREDEEHNEADIGGDKDLTGARVESAENEEKNINFTDVDYAFNSIAKQMTCLLCPFEGKAIVQHYKQAHPDSEVIISRLPVDEACRAVTESTEKGYNNRGFKEGTLSGKRRSASSFLCRFCNYSAQFVSSFYEHTSSHTGEYRYQCCKCTYMGATRTAFKGHFYHHHPNNKIKQGLNLKVLAEGPPNSAKTLFGYLCSCCNFVQLLEENLEKHISLRHKDNTDVKIIRINLSRPVENEDKVTESDGEDWMEDTEIRSDDEVGERGKESLHAENDTSVISEKSDLDKRSVKHADAKKDDSLNGIRETEEKVEEIDSKPKPPEEPKHLEAFLPMSSEVDCEASVLSQERIDRMSTISQELCLNEIIANLQKTDDDICVILEFRIQTIKLEDETEDKLMNQKEESSIENTEPEKMDVDSAISDRVTKVECDEGSEKENVEIAPQVALDISAADNSEQPVVKDTSVSVEESSEVCEPVNENEKSVSDSVTIVSEEKIRSLIEGKVSGLVSVDATQEKKIKGPLKRLADLNSETNKFALPMVAPEEIGDRRITRSYSKPDDEFPESSKQDPGDSGCDTNFDIIELTDDSDESDSDAEEEEQQNIDEDEKIEEATSPDLDLTLCDDETFIIKGNLLHKVKTSLDCPFTVPEQEEETELRVKEEPLAEKPTIVSSIRIGYIHAQTRSDDTVQYSCVVGYCVFTTSNPLVMQRHVGRNHKLQTWNGICTECNKRVFGEDAKTAPEEHKYPLSFIVEHMTTVHLADVISKQSPLVTDLDDSASVLNENTESPDTDICDITQLETEDETKEAAPPPQAPRIRMRRLSGDKLSKPAVPDDQDSTSETFAQNLNATENFPDSPVEEQSMLRIENVVSLRPDATLDPVIQDTTEMQLVPIIPRSSASSITIAPATGSNIPQPLVNLSQIMRPGRVILPKDTSSLVKTTGIWSGGAVHVPGVLTSSVLKKLPTPPITPLTQAYIASNPNDLSQSSSNVVVANSLQSSTFSAITPPTIIRAIPSSSVPILPAPTDRRYTRVVLPLQMETPHSRTDLRGAVKNTLGFANQGCARTSFISYKRHSNKTTVTVNNTRQNLSHKVNKISENAKAQKLMYVYEAMLTDEKLRHLFKCMARHCTYTTDSVVGFEEHCMKHIHVYRKMYRPDGDESEEVILEELSKDFAATSRHSEIPNEEEDLKMQLGYWSQCAYCGATFGTPNELNQHVQECHGYCLYQCSYCFFRAMSYSYVTLHENTSHVNMRVRVLLCHQIPGILPLRSAQKPRKEVIMLYVCNQGHCGQKFCNPAAFWRHLTGIHSNLTYYYCHMCVGQYMKPETLLTHYKLHSYCFYQCQYCLHGTDTKEEMQHHLCNFHPNQKAEVIVRNSDPNMPATGTPTDTCADDLNVVSLDDVSSSDRLCVSPMTPLSQALEETEMDFWTSYSALIEEYKIDPATEKLLSAVVDLTSHPRVSDINREESLCPKDVVDTSLVDDDVLFEECVSRSRSNSTDSDIMVLDDGDEKEEAVESSAGKDSSQDKTAADMENDTDVVDDDNDDYDADSDVMIIDASPVASPTKKRKLSDSSVEQISPVKQLCGEKHLLPRILLEDQAQEDNSTTKSKEADGTVEVVQLVDQTEPPKIVNESELATDGLPTEKETNIQPDRLRTDNGGKQVNLDADLLVRCHISPEELAKTGRTGEDLYKCGNHTCTYAAVDANELREHLLICDLSRESTGMNCVHCQRPFKQITPYLEHLKVHGICRYSCAVCLFRAPLPQHVAKHMKQKHRVFSSRNIPVNRLDTNPETALFIVCPKDKPKPKITTQSRNKRIFSPGESDNLPNKYIVNNALSCGACTFKTKVVGNLRRHLGFHRDPNMKPSDIPDCDPVNPVPCLEKKEMMFDKMTNLAASSHPLGRMSGTQPSVPSVSIVAEKFPKYVPEHERYVCGAPGCNYLTCDETMLRHHLRALHSDEVAYRCPHCPDSLQKEISGPTISIDRLGAHLKMHDSRLYRCTHCYYYHFQRHIVERHVSDKHPEKRSFVQIVREPTGETAGTSKSDDISMAESSSVVSSSYVWICGLCEARYSTRAEVVEHTSTTHNCKSQYKCGACTFRSSSKVNCETHFYSRHPDIPLDLVTVYTRVDGGPADTPVTVAPVEASAPKRFDTTPLWLRNMSRVRHIRGVLLENEEETQAHLQKIEEENAPKKPKPKEPTPSPFSSSQAPSPVKDIKDHLEEKFASYGKPVNGNMFLCTLCMKYKTRFKADMRDHLYRELNYSKFMCQHCGMKSSSKNQLQRHHKVHERQFKPERIENLERNVALEEWVENLLTKQHHDMKGVPDVVPSKSINSAIRAKDGTPSTTPATTPATSPSATPAKSFSSSGVKSCGKFSNTKEDGGSESEPAEKPGAVKRKLPSTVARDLGGFEGVPSKRPCVSVSGKQPEGGEEDEIIDVDDSSVATESLPQQSPSNTKETTIVYKKALKCRDCKASFCNARGLKIHVRLAHLRLGSYACGYCDHLAYSEASIKQHLRNQHPKLPENVIHNKEASSIKLGDEFWEKEYGITPKNTEVKAQKESPGSLTSTSGLSSIAPEVVDPSPVDSDDILIVDELGKCRHCEYRCKSTTDLRNHEMRHWVKKPFKCGYCSFESIREYEVKRHCIKSHPTLKLRVVQQGLPPQPDIKPLQSRRKPLLSSQSDSLATGASEAGQKDVESTSASTSENATVNTGGGDAAESLSSAETSEGAKKIFRCFYCPLRATSLAVIHQHWHKIHKLRMISSSGAQRNLPFRYKEINMAAILKDTSRKKKPTIYVCEYCNAKGSLANMNLHHKEKHADLPIKIVGQGTVTQYECPECPEFVALSVGTLKRHFEAEHPGVEFRYMVRSVTQSSSDIAIESIASETTLQGGLSDVESPRKSPAVPSAGKAPSTKQGVSHKYICAWCGEVCTTEEKISFHQLMYHSHLEQKFKVEENVEPTADIAGKVKVTFFVCPKCPHKSTFFDIMCEHLRKHCRPFKCGHCNRLFDLPMSVRQHSSQCHPLTAPKIVSLNDTQSEVEALKKFITASEEEIDSSEYEKILELEKKSEEDKEVPRKKMRFGFARKSTSMKQKLFARKSTNPVPHKVHPKFGEAMLLSDSNYDSSLDEEERGNSCYGRKPEHVDLSQFSTYVNIVGTEVKVQASSLSHLFRLRPVVLVEDIMKRRAD